MTFNVDNMPSEDDVKEALVQEIERGYNKINTEIDELSSADLKRVLKAITYVHQAGDLLYSNKVELSEQEAGLIDRIYAFQEPIMMLQHQLMQEGMEESVSENKENDNE